MVAGQHGTVGTVDEPPRRYHCEDETRLQSLSFHEMSSEFPANVWKGRGQVKDVNLLFVVDGLNFNTRSAGIDAFGALAKMGPQTLRWSPTFREKSFFYNRDPAERGPSSHFYSP